MDRVEVELPDEYDGDPYGETVPFCVGSNQYLVVIDPGTVEREFRALEE